MTQQQHAFGDSTISDAGRHYARLDDVRGLVEKIAGRPVHPRDRALDESARVSSAYDGASPLVQRRFDTLACEMSGWAAAAMDALAAADDPRRKPNIAARRLAEELDDAMADLKKLLRA